MDFLKKNIGLLISATVSIILAIILLSFLLKTNKRLNSNLSKMKSELSFFDRAAQDAYKLSAPSGEELENLVQSNKNLEDATRFYNDGRDLLAKKYTIEPALPLNSPEALKQINERIRLMTDFTLKNGVEFQGLAKEFVTIVGQGNVSSSEFRPLFRLLTIYDHLVQKIVRSGIKYIEELHWPLGFAVQDEDFYTITPVSLTFYCDMETGQNFLNDLVTDDNLLFYIKSVSTTAPDSYSKLLNAWVSQNKARASAGAGQSDAFAGMGGMSQYNPGASERGRQRGTMDIDVSASGGTADRNIARLLNRDGSFEATRESDRSAASRYVVPEPRRQDYLAFAEKDIKFELRLDLYEFKKAD